MRLNSRGAVILIAGLALVNLVAVFGLFAAFRVYRVPNAGMEPSLKSGSYVVARQFGLDPITRGDIVVFKYPQDLEKSFVRRVIGLPGETIEIRKRLVFVDGQPVKDPWKNATAVKSEEYMAVRDNFGPFVVPEDSFFVLGDNRDHSLDSRYWGTVRRGLITGKVHE